MKDNTQIDLVNETDGDEFIQTIMLDLEDGTTEECEILEIIEVDGKAYVALLPLDKDEYHVYGVVEHGEEIEILNIEDEDEYEKVVKAFEEYFDDEDYDDEDDDEEDDDDEDDYEDEEDDDE